MADLPTPTLVSLVLCDRVQRLATGAINLLDVAECIHAPRYPVILNSFLYVRLADAKDGMSLQLEFIDAATLESVGGGHERTIRGASERGDWMLVQHVRLKIPKPGDYFIQLSCAGKLVGQTSFPAVNFQPRAGNPLYHD